VAEDGEHRHQAAGHQRAHLEGGAHAVGLAGAEVLAGHRADREAQGHHRQEQALHHPQPDAEARLRRRAEGRVSL
jgi:hypothetical protein